MSLRPTATAREIEAWANGELPDADVERVVAAVLASEDAAAQLEECLQLRALGHRLGEERWRPSARRYTSEIFAPGDAGDELADGHGGATSAVDVPGDVGPPGDVDEDLDAAGAAARGVDAASGPGLGGDPDPSGRRRSARIAVISSAAAAVVAVALAVGGGRSSSISGGSSRADPRSLDHQIVAALGAYRHIAPRLTFPSFDRHRRYDALRADGAQRQIEDLPFELLAALEKLPDRRAISNARLLRGEIDGVRTLLERADDTADTWSDRAVLALLEGDHEGGLYAGDRALALARDHVQARWNRALALAGLGLDRRAAAVFAEIARRREPGWSTEASERARMLADRHERQIATWSRARAAIAAMVAGGRPVIDLVDEFPVQVREGLYDAVRAATSPARVRELAPLARALDERSGGDVLARQVARVAARPFARRVQVATRYARLLRGELPGALHPVLLEELRAGGRETEDILLGAMPLVASPPRKIAARDLGAYARLAAATQDPWFALLAREQRASVAIDAGDFRAASRELEAVAASCASPSARTLPCYRIARLETYVYLVMHKVTAARDAWRRTWKAVGGTGMTTLREEALRMGASVATLRDDTGGRWHGLARAYLEELQEGRPSCADTAAAHEEIAQSLINQNRLAEATELLESTARCGAPITTRRAFLLGQTSRDPRRIESLLREIATLRSEPTTTAGDRAALAHVEGRTMLLTRPAAGRALLRRVIENANAAKDDVQQARVRGYSYSVLVQEAALRAAWDEALLLLAEETGAALSGRCALGASEEDATVFVARGADGRLAGARVPLAPGQAPGETRLPRELHAALDGCDVVDIHARYPYYGRAGLLRPGVAARFRSRAGAPGTPGAGPVIVIGNVEPPPELRLTPLLPIAAAPGTTLLDGASATPARVLAAMRTAGFVEIHGHGIVGTSDDDAAQLVLSAGEDGRYALTATEVARTTFTRSPVVVLAACDAGSAAPSFHAAWGLADAFLDAGASAVIASPAAIGDAAAPQFFAGVRARIQNGSAPALALRDERETWIDPAQRRWIDQLVVFQ